MVSDRCSPKWALDYAMRYFGFDGLNQTWVLDQISWGAGISFLLDLWNRYPYQLYHSPWFVLRQEWYHSLFQKKLDYQIWLDLKSKDSIMLDYGCGTAEFSRPWIDKGGKTVLADLPGPNRNYISDKFADQNCVITSPKRSLDLGPYDLISCLDVFEHIVDPIKTLKDLYSVLKPAGIGMFWFSPRYPHPGHLEQSIAERPLYEEWIKKVPIVMSREVGIDLIRRPKRIWH